jgi:PAS domain S-box-containing protein
MNVLLVDSNLDDRELIEPRVKSAFPDADLIAVTDQASLKRALARADADIALIEHQLPWSDGLHVLQTIQQHNPFLPVIMLTSDPDGDLVRAGMKAGLSDYLPRHDLDRLSAVMDASLARMQHRKLDLMRLDLQLKAEAEQRARVESRLADQAYLLANLSDAVFASDAEGIITSWNQASVEIFGWTAREAVGRNVRELLGAEFYGANPAKTRREMRMSGCVRAELIQRHKDGHAVPIEVITVGLQGVGGNPAGRVSVCRDISARKAAEAAELQHRQRLEILHEIDRSILAAQSAAVLAQDVARRIRAVFGCQRSEVVVFDLVARQARMLAAHGVGSENFGPGTCVPLELRRMFGKHREGRAAAIEDLAALADLLPMERDLLAAGLRSFVSLPLLVNGELIGTLNLWRSVPGQFAAQDVALAAHIADSLAVALQHTHLDEQAQTYRAQLHAQSRGLVEVLEGERSAIARELHDEAGQALTSLLLNLSSLERDPDCPRSFLPRIAEMKQSTDSALIGLHRMTMKLRPISLDRLGLMAALSQYVATYQNQIDVQVDMTTVGMEDRRLPSEIEATLYRVVQEALTNVARHAQASQVSIVVEWQSERVVAIVEDNGQGFEVAEAIQGGRLGLVGMRERAEMLGGTLTIESTAGAGTTVFVELPISNTQSGAPVENRPGFTSAPQVS